MRQLFEKLRQRKIVQWSFAYVAAAWVAVEAVNVLGEIFGLPVALQRSAVVVLAFGFVIAVVLAWYHGEKGRQRVSGLELLIVTAVLTAGGATLTFVFDRAAGGAEAGVTAVAARGPSVPDRADEADPRSVAVLPFADMSPEGNQEYLADGIAEELLSQLSQVEGLRVASRTSSSSLEGRNLDIREIGRRLGVASVIEGSVRKSGTSLRVEARLVSVDDGFRIWSDRFHAEAADIFAVQDSIALSVVRALRVRLAADATVPALRGQTSDPVAQDLYLRGRFAWNRRTHEGLEEAVTFFDSAVARDSTYARALVGLGDAHAVLGFYDYLPPAVAFPRAKEAAGRALAVDSTLAAPHATLGYVALYYDWEWAEAERQFLRAIELDPGYPVAHQWYANLLTALGRFDEAAREMRTASELDPLSMIAFSAIGWVHLYAGENERAIRQLEEAIRRDPSFELAYLWNGQAHEALGRFEGAEALVRRSVELSGGSAISRAALARVLALGGRTGEARRLLRELEREGEGGYVPAYEIARAYIGLGELDTALARLQRAYRDRAPSMAFLGVDPKLEPLHGSPGYRDLLSRLGLGAPR